MNKKTNKKRKSKKPVRVEKTLQIVTGREFVQRDEFHGAEDPMPDITVRDLNKQRKLAERMAAEEQRRADEERANAIKVSTAGVEDTPPDEEEQPVRKSEKKKKSDTNVTDIQAVRQKEKNKKYIRKIAAAVTVVAVAVCVYCLRGRWVPKLEGILDKPHETIVNDGKTESGNFPLSVNDESTGQMTDFDGYLVMLDENHLKVYSESGEEVSSFSHSYADPVVKTAKKRMLLYDNGGNSFKVVNRKSEFFENKTDNSILMAEIADNSYTAVVTQSDKYASVVTVYDSNGIEIYNWSSSGRILDIEFNSEGTGCYISTFSSSGGKLQSTVRYITFSSTDEVMKSVKLDSIVMKIMPTDNGDIWAVGDDSFYKLDSDGNIILEYEYGESLVDFDLTEATACIAFKGVSRKTGKIVMFSSDSESTDPDSVVEIDCGDPKNVYIKDGMIMLLSDSEIDSYDTTGNLLATAEASSEYVDFTYFNSNVYFLGYREINKIAFNT